MYRRLIEKNRAVTIILCFISVVAALVHWGIYGTKTFSRFSYMYAESLISLGLLIPGKKKIIRIFRSVSVSAVAFILCMLFWVDFIGNGNAMFEDYYDYELDYAVEYLENRH